MIKESYKRTFLIITAFSEGDVIATSLFDTGNNGTPVIPITKAPSVSAPKSPMLSMDDKNKW